MHNKTINRFWWSYDIKNCRGLGLCYLPQSLASADNSPHGFDNRSADVISRGFDAICVRPLIYNSQWPFKMHKKVSSYCKNAKREILTRIKLNHITYTERTSKASLPSSHCDPLKPAGHSHFSELALQVLLFSHETQLQLND